MDTISLKRYIYENSKIEYVLTEIGCHNIVYHPNKEFYSCGNHNGDNKGAINVRNNEYLGVVNYTRTKEFEDNSDIITLVQYNKSMSFVEAIKYLHKILNLPFEFKKGEGTQKKKDPLEIFKRIANRRRAINVAEIQALEEKLLNDYIPLLHLSWVKEGITERTRKKFGICYSYRYKRIIIPIRHWATGEIIATNARTTVENYDAFGIQKYILSTGYNKQLNLYGLYENYDAIQKAGYVTVYESEKSVLKRDALCDSTGVAISGHSLSQEQVAILIGLNVDIIISMDKDVSLEEIRHLCSKFYNIRNVYYTYDSYDLLNKKESIADKPNKIFNFFMKHKIKYDKHENELYMKGLKKR